MLYSKSVTVHLFVSIYFSFSFFFFAMCTTDGSARALLIRVQMRVIRAATYLEVIHLGESRAMLIQLVQRAGELMVGMKKGKEHSESKSISYRTLFFFYKHEKKNLTPL